MMRDHKPVSIADQVFEQLERDILSGKYPQGEVLSELRLSGELGVSRTPSGRLSAAWSRSIFWRTPAVAWW